MGEDGPSGDAGSGGDIGPKASSLVYIHNINLSRWILSWTLILQWSGIEIQWNPSNQDP